MIHQLFGSIADIAAGWVVAITTLQLGLVISAMVEMRRLRQRDRHQVWRRVLRSPLAPRISILVPAYNEEVTVCDTVAGLLALSYPNLEVVVVNDGSPDETASALISRFDLRPVHPVYQRLIPTADVKSLYRSSREPRLVLVDKFNGGKADSLNAGINVASGDMVCAIDADTLVAPDALQQLVAPFLMRSDTVAVGGTVRLTNDSRVRAGRVTELVVPKKPLVAFQAVEYLRAFIIGRLGWNPLGGNLIISGAFGLFSRQAVLDAGGYEHSSIGEDMELIVRLRRHGHEIGEPAWVEFLPEPVAWTEAPDSIRVLARQRNRWERGLIDVLSRHRRMILNPRYGAAGMLAMPFFFLVELVAPVVEAIALVLLLVGLVTGLVDPAALWILGAAYGFGAAVTVLTLWFDDVVFHSYARFGHRLKLAFYAAAEQIVYRQLTIVWRLWGLRLYVQGRTEWGQQVRRGFTTG